jgi:hypothetical protein
MNIKVKHGGARTGAGRQTKASKQLIAATELLRHMSQQVEGGLGTLAENFPALVAAEVELALHENEYSEQGKPVGPVIDEKVSQRARQFLITKALDVIKVGEKDPEDSMLGKWLRDMRREDDGADMAGQNQGTIQAPRTEAQ